MAPVGPLLARLLSEPLAMCQVRGGAALRALAAMGPSDMPMPSMPDMPMRDPDEPAVVGISGVLVRRGLGLGPEIDAMCGICAYDTIVDQVRAAAGDPSVPSIVLEIDSPGGEVAGVLDAADAIRAARTSKPVVAISEGCMASAAYVLGAAAGKVILSRTAWAGSVGVMVEHVDMSAALAMDGVKVDLITAGAKKADGAPSVPLSPSARAEWQSRVNDAWALLCESVGQSRGMKSAAVKALEAGIYRGQDAVKAGLADSIGTLDSVTEGLKATGSSSSPFGARAPWPNRTRAIA